MMSLAVPEALACSDELAEHLSDPQVVWPDGPPGGGRFWPQSLASGAAGIALLHIERARAGRGTWETAHTWLSLATSGEVTAASNASLFFGAPALALVLHIAASASNRYQRPLAALDEAVVALTERRLDEAHARIGRAEQPEMREFDLVRGLTGLATYHLARHPGHEITRDALAYLARFTEPLPGTGDRPPWWTPVGPNGEPSSDYPQGHGNFGVSHGIGSVIAALSLGRLRGIAPAVVTDAITRLCTWTDQWRQGDAEAPWWPGLITPGQVRKGRIPTTLRPSPSWCYGAAGSSRAQQLAGMALEEADRRQAAENTLLVALRDPQQLSSLKDPGLCHGTAGLLHCAWRTANDAGSPDIRKELPHLAAQVIEESRQTRRPTEPGLLDGTAGIALALHAIGTGSTPMPCWDSFLSLN
jgi:lantibiotic biosynthesis protein